MASSNSKPLKRLLVALSFLTPNILGVLTFVVFPVIFAVMLAFTNWDLRRHNMFKEETVQFVGLDNFIRLLTEGDFVRFLGNTLFLMMGIPFAVGGALMAAILLSKDTTGGNRKVHLYLLASAIMIVSVILLTTIGMANSAMTILLVSVACGIVIIGMTGGVSAYRTLFYMPHFTAGIATFLLWKKLYNPEQGPINDALEPVLGQLTLAVVSVGDGPVMALRWIGIAFVAVMLWLIIGKLAQMYRDGDLGWRGAILPCIVTLIPLAVALRWGPMQGEAPVLLLAVVAAIAYRGWQIVSLGRDLTPSDEGEGFGSALMIALGAMTVSLIALGVSATIEALPYMAGPESNNLIEPPNWLTDYHWAKPSLMIMALWGAIGSNNMLLYLAALTNVPQELYEAADIDGAKRLQRFWNVTWPQLAPTTFFIAVMSTIYGLQGGFEMARVMTQGGPDKATTTLSYFVYQEGFETGRLSFAAATAWTLFLLVFSITMFNWRFGNRYTND